MKTTMNFTDFKTEILKNIEANKEFDAEHLKVFQTYTFHDLCQVIKDNFELFCKYNFITGELLDAVGNDELNIHGIAVNKSINFGYLYAFGNAKVKVRGISFFYACDKALIRAYDRTRGFVIDAAEVFTHDSSTVIVHDKVVVFAHDNSIITAFGSSTVNASDNSTVFAFEFSTVNDFYANIFAFDNSQIKTFNVELVTTFGKANVMGY
jgi:hypothetical protein